MSGLLVVAGEASGDRAAAAVVSRLGSTQVFGLGGGALAATGAVLLRRLESHNSMGIVEPLRHAVLVRKSFRTIVSAAAEKKPRAALLVGYSEFNMNLAPVLQKQGVKVLWYAAPQVWAWRRGRVSTLKKCVDRMALVLPFEERLWRDAGVDATYVGHPSFEGDHLPASSLRESLGIAPKAPVVAILPGSRPDEVRSLLTPMLEGFEIVRRDRASVDACVLIASALDEETREWVRGRAREYRVATTVVDPRAGAYPLLGAFDASLCASGTASLEAAMAGAPPVVLYRVNLATEAVARLVLRTPNIALPNILLGTRVFEELTQRDVEARRIAVALTRILSRKKQYADACEDVRNALGPERAPSARVAAMLAPWL